MFSIRSRVVLCASLALALVATGCQWRKPEKPAAVENYPLPPDPAIQLREWPQQTALYANGATVAGPTGYVLEPKENQPEYTDYYDDFATWTANTVMMPFVLMITPPWTEEIYRGEYVLATYTGQPPLPPQMAPGYMPKGIRPPVTAMVARKSTTTTTATTSMSTTSPKVVRPTMTIPVAPTTRPATTSMNR